MIIWHPGWSMPALIFDEANWFPEETQAALLQAIDTGRVNYAGQSYDAGKRPTFFAINT